MSIMCSRFGIALAVATTWTLALGNAGCSTPAADAYPTPAMLATVPAGPRFVFLSMGRDTFRRVAVAPLDAPEHSAYVTSLSCERVYFAGGRGLCLTIRAKGTSQDYKAEVFDEQFQRLHTIPLTGNPSRVRVSPDGRRAAATVFESGHSYAAHEQFSTRTLVFDLASGRVLGDLEAFRALKDGKRFDAVDFNVWGLSFAADRNTFYATLATGGTNYLVRGSVDEREMHVVRPGIECPSLSPDNSRIVFKKRIGSSTSGWWQLAALDLASMEETLLLGESRSVDDQVEWLDNKHVLYQMTGTGTAADVWVVEVSRNGEARPFARAAYSPAVVRETVAAGQVIGRRKHEPND
jgi:hypothetical protein